MSDRTQGQILINAPRERILDVIGDVPAYPEWATGTTAAEVTEAGAVSYTHLTLPTTPYV